MTTLERTSGTNRLAVVPAAAMVAAPLLIVIGNALHPVVAANSVDALLDTVAASPGRWILAKVLYAFGSLLLIPALGSVVRISPRPAVLIGAVLAGIGTGCNVMSQALTGYTAYSVIDLGIDRGAGAALLTGYDKLGAAGLPVSYAGVPVLLLGMIVVGVALIVNRDVPRTAAILLLVGTVAAGLAQAGPLALIAGAPLVAAFVLLARARLARS